MKISDFNEADTIKSVIEYTYNESADASLDIAYGIDENFLFGCGISISSLLLNNPEENLVFHVFTDTVSDEFCTKFDLLAQQFKTKIIIYLIDCEQLKNLPTTKNWSYATYFRFIIADYFSAKLKRVLYLDADIFCKGSIHDIVHLEFTNNTLAAVVAENDQTWWNKRAELLSVPALKKGYFNAGFLLINLKQWAAENISKKAMELLADPVVSKKITHLDQDILNMLLVGKVIFLEKKYNTRLSINYELKKNFISPVNDETVLIHYIGPTKPWHSWGNYPVADSFIAAKKASPWKEDKLLPPVNSSQFRYCAKHKYNQKHYLEWIGCYMKYYKQKFVAK
ncbi:lipopolysaccharide 3-alpha-galactosyltransferase [Vagococcus sp. WN89Y]|uniref:lipopolysaccharide 3-alpha-galactosyltransferase n=1 Tax=Vagococcus sp. WN89Y TaxID=3457258 RepID=UPI003FCC5788